MGEDGVGTQVDEAQRHRQLHGHIEETYLHMSYLQLVGHQLVGVLAVRLTQVLVKHDAVDNRAASIHAVYQQEHQVGDVARLHYQFAEREQHDEGDAYAAHIPCEAFGFPFGAEVEDAEHQHPDDCHHQVRRLDKPCDLIADLIRNLTLNH